MNMPGLLEARRSVLVVIDLQGKLMEMVERPAMVIEATRRLIALAELFEVPLILTEQYPQGLGPTHESVREAFDAFGGWKRYLDKTSFGCCGDQSFIDTLAEARPGMPPRERQIVVAGIEAHVCVMQTVLPLLAEGSEVHVCWDAVSARGEEYRRFGLMRMKQAGAAISNHESVGFEWARDKSHPRFKAMSAIFKAGQPA
jgi:nicotinamidase-related amidase